MGPKDTDGMANSVDPVGLSSGYFLVLFQAV